MDRYETGGCSPKKGVFRGLCLSIAILVCLEGTSAVNRIYFLSLVFDVAIGHHNLL